VRRWLPTSIVAALVVLALAYWERRMAGPLLVPQEISRWSSDLYEQYIPVWTFAYRGPRLLPSWNPYQLAGVPFIATFGIGGLLYPASFLATVVGVPHAMGWACAIHVALAGLFTLACGRALGLMWPAAALSAAAFMLDTSFLAERIHPACLFGLAWIPAVFLLAGRMVAAPRAWAGCQLGIGLAAQILTYPQLACFQGYAMLLLLAVHLLLVRPGATYARRLTVAATAAVATAALLSAAQWLPTLELVAHAGRGPGGLPLEQIMGPQPLQWQEYVVPTLFSAGPLALLLPWAFADRRRPVALVLATLLLVFAILVGFGTSFYTQVFYRLPAVDLFRLPSRALPLATFAIAILAGIGIDTAVRHRWGRTWPHAIVIAAASAAVILFRWHSPPSVTLPLAVVVAAALAAVLPRPRARAVMAWAVVLLLVVERWNQPNFISIPQSNPAEFFAPPPFVEFLRERVGVDRIVVIKDWKKRFPIMEKMGTLYGFRVVQDYEPLTAARYHEFLSEFDGDNTDRPAFGGRFFPPPGHRAWRRLDLLGVRYVVVAPGKPWWPHPGRFRRVYQKKDATIYENLASLPRAFLTTATRIEKDPQATLRRMRAENFDPLTEAVIDDEVVWKSATADESIAAAVEFGQVDDDAVVLSVSTPTRALLVLTDLFWPGWRVSIDGEERRIQRADYLFRGVAVEPGRHTIRFWYDPLSVKLGFAISAATLVLLVVWAVARAYPMRRSIRRSGTNHMSATPA
jgi:hypothetical protein